MMAMARSSSLRLCGTRDPRRVITPRAKAMSVAIGIAPALQRQLVAAVEPDVDERGDREAADRADQGQSDSPPGRELAHQELSLDLEPHQEEEHRHQSRR